MNVATSRMAFRRVSVVKPSSVLRSRILRQARPFHNSRAMFRTKEEDHSAHTITQRIRSLKKIPPELLPLGVVILFALGAAAFAMGKKIVTDKTLRLNRSGPKKEAH